LCFSKGNLFSSNSFLGSIKGLWHKYLQSVCNMTGNRPTYSVSVGIVKERKIATKVVTTCVTVKTCVEWGGYTHCMDSFFSCPYTLDGLHIWAVTGCVTVRVVNSYWPLDFNTLISKLSGVHARMRNNMTPLMCKEN
jgi:hypothetical protein